MSTATVQLVLLGQARDLQVINDPPAQSRWSGKPLKRIHFQLRVANEGEHESLEAELTRTAIARRRGLRWWVEVEEFS